jgi:hypothetical protein
LVLSVSWYLWVNITNNIQWRFQRRYIRIYHIRPARICYLKFR